MSVPAQAAGIEALTEREEQRVQKIRKVIRRVIPLTGIEAAFRQSPYFDVVGYYNDEDEIAEAMRDGEIVGCLIFPADFTRKMQLGQQAEVLLGSSAVNMGYGSTINLKGMPMDEIATVVKLKGKWEVIQ